MPAAADFDLLILGGGCAGLSLAMRLAEAGYRGKVGIVEPRTHYHDDRSWCFWARDDGRDTHVSLRGLASRRWRQWRFARYNRSVRECSVDGWSYQYVNSLAFYQRALAAIEARPNITLMLGEAARAMKSLGGRVHVETADRTLTGNEVVDTRPPERSRLIEAPLYQCFVGRQVRLDDRTPNAFEPAAVELMTDMRTDQRGFQFSYVLPFDARRALVEVTRFSPAPIAPARLDGEVDELLRRRGWRVAATDRTECGVLPMGLPHPAGQPAPGVVRAGTGGGALRAASGYGFQRIQRWAADCSASLSRGGPALGQARDGARQRFMDGLFLQVIRDRPRLAPMLFERMACGVPGPVFIRFMSDQAGWADSVRVVASLPPAPFLKSLLRVGRSDSTPMTMP
ncbi:MAG: lycopene cyclase family protein [Wenzhouxiangella sp.]